MQLDHLGHALSRGRRKNNPIEPWAVTLVAVPAAALASGSPSNRGTQNAAAHRSGTSEHPGPDSSLPAKAKAYGRYCQGQGKRHVAGQAGTPFSQCVTAMAELNSRGQHLPESRLRVAEQEARGRPAGNPVQPVRRECGEAARGQAELVARASVGKGRAGTTPGEGGARPAAADSTT